MSARAAARAAWAVSQAVWDSQETLTPEESRSIEAGYRIVQPSFQASAAIYDTQFDNRLLQYNPCNSRAPVGPDCGNRFYNVGGVDYDIYQLTSREGSSATRISFDAVTSRSYHSGIVNVLLMDGSVRSVSNSISQAAWRAAATRAGGEVNGIHN